MKKTTMGKLIEVLFSEDVGLNDGAVPGDIDEEDEGDEDEKEASISEIKKMTLKVDYTIKDDNYENPIGEKGEKEIVADDEKSSSIGTYLWDSVIKQLDYDLLDSIKNKTALKFVLDAELELPAANDRKSLKIIFDLKDGEIQLVGWAFGADTGVGKDSLDELNKKIDHWIRASLPV